jgi:thymidylate synthase
VKKTDRTGVGAISTFGYQMRFNLQQGFPAVTTKRLAWKSVVSELLWFLEGSTDERRLAEILYGTRDLANSTIWTDNANADYWKHKAKFEGDLGKGYGYQWRNFNGVDQLSQLIEGLKTDPNSRRHIISAWNPADLAEMALPPCHVLCQFYVANNTLSCQLYQRSCDMFLGVPFNIASYALLTHIIARECNFEVGEFIWTGGDLHIYNNHINAVNLQLSREPRELPSLLMSNSSSLSTYTVKDFKLDNYNPHPAISAEMAV